MPVDSEVADLFHRCVATHVDPNSAPWPAASTAHGQLRPTAVIAALSAAGRRLGSGVCKLEASQVQQLSALGFNVSDPLPVALLARVSILLDGLLHVPPTEHVGLVSRAFRTGSNEERVALLKALPHLPSAERFCDVAQEACRSHVQQVFEAIACDNVYAARHFDQASYRQLVLKVLFVASPLARVVGLAVRTDAELIRMVHDFAAERRAAGRPVPADAALVAPNLEILQ